MVFEVLVIGQASLTELCYSEGFDQKVVFLRGYWPRGYCHMVLSPNAEVKEIQADKT